MAPTRALALLQLLLPLLTAEAFTFHGTSACRLLALTSAHRNQRLLLLTQAHVLAFGAATGSTVVAHRHAARQTAAARRTATTSMRLYIVSRHVVAPVCIGCSNNALDLPTTLHIFTAAGCSQASLHTVLRCTAATLLCTLQLEIGGGSYVALVTPMMPSGAVDEPTLRALLQWHAASGTDGVVVLGTTGEASTLTDAERSVVLQATVEEIGGK
eukprot:3711-Heterococcus_DN1.PRE.7